jgi:hypothetical protein
MAPTDEEDVRRLAGSPRWERSLNRLREENLHARATDGEARVVPEAPVDDTAPLEPAPTATTAATAAATRDRSPIVREGRLRVPPRGHRTRHGISVPS